MISENLDYEYKITDKDEERFDNYLISLQPDIEKLLMSKRKHNHRLAIDEILSDFNLSLIKAKEKFIRFRDDEHQEFTKKSFHYLMCVYAKNAVSWFASRENNRKYNSRRLDFLCKSEDGEKTSFEIACDILGEDEKCKDAFENEKYKYVFTLIKDSTWFTTKEIELIDLLLKGHKQVEIFEMMDVTHQAISFNILRIKEKIKHRFKFNVFSDESWAKISTGNKAIKELFSHEINF